MTTGLAVGVAACLARAALARPILASCAALWLGANGALAGDPPRLSHPAPVLRTGVYPDLPPAEPTLRQVDAYRSVFFACEDGAGRPKLAIRQMALDNQPMLLLVDGQTLATELAPAALWSCAETTNAAQAATRYLTAIHAPAKGEPPASPYIRNGGLTHGAGEGAFVTGDLCPSAAPLDRDFLESLAAASPAAPVALSITGHWLLHHPQDFAWLRAMDEARRLSITWVNHSFHHPYEPRRPLAQNFLLLPGVDVEREIFETERLLIAHGVTPSVFFRFPGLISDAATMDLVRAHHLVVLGADGWLAMQPKVTPGAVVLVHPNGNEPKGLRVFHALLRNGALPLPLRPIAEAP